MTPDIGVAPALGQRGRHGAIFYLWPAIACHTDGYLCPATAIMELPVIAVAE